MTEDQARILFKAIESLPYLTKDDKVVLRNCAKMMKKSKDNFWKQKLIELVADFIVNGKDSK